MKTIFIQFLKKYIYILIKFRFQQLEYYYERKFFFKSDEFSHIFHSILLSQELVAIGIYIYRDRSHESWPEARRSYRVQN